MASSRTCKSGAEHQIADQVISECPIYKASNGVHSLNILDKDSKVWLATICPEILFEQDRIQTKQLQQDLCIKQNFYYDDII